MAKIPYAASHKMGSAHFPVPLKESSMSLINTPVQPFKTTAFHAGEFVEVTEASLKGKWSVLVFMPAAFTFN